MKIGKIITINDISIEIILSSNDIKIGDILEVEGNNTKANWIESYFDVLVITKKHEFVEKY